MTEATNVVPFPGTPPPPAPEPAAPPGDWEERFREDTYPHFCSLVEQLGWAEDEKQLRTRMADIKAAVSAWPV